MPARVTVEGPTCAKAAMVDGTWKGSSVGEMAVRGQTSWEYTPMSVT